MIKYSLILLMALAGSASAITIQMGRGLAVGVNVLTTGNTAIAGGYQIKIGTFTAAPAADATFAQVMAAFKEFATTTSPTTGTSSGLITATDATSKVAVSTALTAPDFNTNPIYFLIGDTSSSATWSYFGVLKGQTPTASSWTFPADTTGTASVNAISSSVSAITPVIGSEIDNATGADSFRLVSVVPIPEPSSMFLALGALAIGFRRKR